MGSGSGSSTPVKRDGFIETAFPAAASFTTLLANKALKKMANNHKSDPENPSIPTPIRGKRRLPRAHIAQRRLLGVEDHPVAEAIFFRSVRRHFCPSLWCLIRTFTHQLWSHSVLWLHSAQ